MSKYVWKQMDDDHCNWPVLKSAKVAYGMKLLDDPQGFIHRAIVYSSDNSQWCAEAWGIDAAKPRYMGWIPCGEHKTKLGAMRVARAMARLFDAPLQRQVEKDNE